jgi:heme-degrading monooxygenase HmoA
MSNIVKIISKKIITQKLNQPSYKFLDQYINSLNKSVKNQPGFIKSNSYWEFETNNIITNSNTIKTVCISEWKSTSDWNKWHTSKERLDIYNNYKILDKIENFSILKKRKSIDNVFLL